MLSAVKAELSKLQDRNSGIQEEIKRAAAKVGEKQIELGKAMQEYGAVEADLNRLRTQYRSLERTLEQLELDDDLSVVDNMRKSLDELNNQIAELEEEFTKLNASTSQKENEIQEVNEELNALRANFAEAKKRIADLENEEEDIIEKGRSIDAAVDSDKRRLERIRDSLANMELSSKQLQEEKVNAEERNEEEDIIEKGRTIDAAVDSDKRRLERIRDSLANMELSSKQLQEEKANAEERVGANF
ncbi:unnamed protein product [Strongylus vulgaris]|uniref:Myosin tail domain-containing protein n=1 Tax=Strongylus vulgaris TaxID=40348 RepID=A0A3P7JJ86_STRVU|nr:unnamed protein product [Strongylus vulgaris]